MHSYLEADSYINLGMHVRCRAHDAYTNQSLNDTNNYNIFLE